VKKLYPTVTLEVYGSIPHKIDSEGSDIDVSIMRGDLKVDELEMLDNIGNAFLFSDSSFIAVTKILTARIPLVTITDLYSKIQLDISFWMFDKFEISRVINTYLGMDERARTFLKSIKYWAKSRNINDCYTGTINSFAWTIMGISFFQIQEIFPPIPDNLDEFENSKYQTTNTKSVGDLLLEFFQWILEFDYTTKRISIRYNGITDKEAEKFKDDSVFIVERPRTPYQNMTRQVTLKTLKRIRYEWHRAVDILQKGGLLNDICSDKDE